MASVMAEGTVLAGKYRLVSLVGRGGMGEVWRAEHLALHAPVAIKLMNSEIVSNPEALARFNREAQAAAALRSPHVVQVLDHGLDPHTGMPFIAMELMEGETLARRLERNGRLSPPDTARVVTHVARALGRAHDVGVVHRDLKPENVFLIQNEDEEIAKVLDFGIAKANTQSLGPSSATRTGAVMGTPYYMSPEQITGAKGVDQRTDLWALGVIACECLVGRRPFDAETIGGLVLAICTAPLPRPSELAPVPVGFDRWFERAVARDPNQRFQNARELAEELRRVCAGEVRASAPEVLRTVPMLEPAVPASTVGPLSHTAPDIPLHRPGGLAIGAVVLLAAVLGGGVWFFSSARSEVTGVNSAAAAAPAVSPVPSNERASNAPSVAPAPSVSVRPAASSAPVAPPQAAPPAARVTTAPAPAPVLPHRSVPAAPAPPPAVPAHPAAAPPPAAPPAPAPAPRKPDNDLSIFDRRKG